MHLQKEGERVEGRDPSKLRRHVQQILVVLALFDSKAQTDFVLCTEQVVISTNSFMLRWLRKG